MSVSWSIARRELRSGLRGFRVFFLCLMLGVAAIASVGLVRHAIQQALQEQGAVLLGGDAQLEFTYRRATADERAWIDARAARVSEVIDFRSMLRHGEGETLQTALVQVKGVDTAYPLYGAVETAPQMTLADLMTPVDGVYGALVDPVLADRMGLKAGDPVEIGGVTFRMLARLARAPDETGAGITLGPPVIVATKALEGSRLLDPGALYESEYRLALPAGTDLEPLKTEAQTRFKEAGLRWSDRRRASPAADRFVTRLGSFLVLVGLAGLTVGGVGISSSVASWLDRKAATVATLRAIGASGRTIRWVFYWQLIVLGVAGIAAGLGLACLLVLGSGGLIGRVMPIPVDLRLSAGPMAEAAMYGALVTAIFSLWPLARLSQTRVARLYRARARGLPPLGMLALIALLAAVLVGASMALSGLPWLTLGALGGVAGALALLALTGWLTKRLAARVQRIVRGAPALRVALAGISGPNSEALPVVLSLGLGLSVLSAIGQVDAGLRNAIATDLPKQAPAFFLLDIQPDQLAPFTAQMQADPQVERVETTPMLRGVITRINDRPAREGRPDHWVLRGDRGVTYAATPREKIVAGQFWAPDDQGPPQISFAAKEAQELGLKLGDRLTVNILGRDITAPITSLRDVDFSTAGIGFVITFNPAALAGAPHTHLATLYAPETAEPEILRHLAQAFPNVTAVPVREAIGRLTEALQTIARATSLAASVTLVTGVIVLIGASAAGEARRAWEAALLKTLGASRGRILLAFLLRALILGGVAGLVAVGAGALAGWAVLTQVMELGYHMAWTPALVILFTGMAAALLADLMFVIRPLRVRPARILRQAD
ncbi:FtsX-like permease family protein [Thioclava litoralis]|uniref:FtsX-like permease family protein n=1 Tax=Thioclava litoralis TaxID=3076557 RepID=A0ABZ1E0G5_9RHOB|nr:FtsX-like permease family protein [Thioclava sp. FTW29]